MQKNYKKNQKTIYWGLLVKQILIEQAVKRRQTIQLFLIRTPLTYNPLHVIIPLIKELPLLTRRLVLNWVRPPYSKAVVLFSEHYAQRNNSHDYQAELEQFAICNHRHHLPSRESDQPPNGNSFAIVEYSLHISKVNNVLTNFTEKLVKTLIHGCIFMV